MKHTVFLSCLLLCAFTHSLAQSVDYDKIIPAKTTTDSVDMPERLVRLAWQNNPGNEVLLREANIASLEVRKAKTAWLNNIVVSGNLNEYSTERLVNDLGGTESDDPLVNNFFPIYNFGVTLPLGIFFENPKNTKIAVERQAIAEENVNARKLNLRALVLTQYQDFLMNKKILEVQASITENQYAKFQVAEKQFQNNTTSLEEYEELLQSYNQERINSARAEKDFLTAKILLEELIGVRMEDIQ